MLPAALASLSVFSIFLFTVTSDLASAMPIYLKAFFLVISLGGFAATYFRAKRIILLLGLLLCPVGIAGIFTIGMGLLVSGQLFIASSLALYATRESSVPSDNFSK